MTTTTITLYLTTVTYKLQDRTAYHGAVCSKRQSDALESNSKKAVISEKDRDHDDDDGNGQQLPVPQ